MVLMTHKELGRIERSRNPASLGFSTIHENSVSDDSFLICILSPHHPKSSLLNKSWTKINNHPYHQDHQPGQPRHQGGTRHQGEPGRTVFQGSPAAFLPQRHVLAHGLSGFLPQGKCKDSPCEWYLSKMETTLQEINISHLGKKENHLQNAIFGGYVSFLEGSFSNFQLSFFRGELC